MLYYCLFLFALFMDCNLSLAPWPPKIGYYYQKITHFSYPKNNPKFKSRYFYEDKWFRPKGPIFFYCGNEGSITGFWLHNTLLFEIAPAFEALVIYAEHRYYGSSLPYTLSFEQPWIQYLSIHEALADYADLILHLKEVFNAQDSQVIVFGGSYGGILSAYMRLLYPHIVQGAISASAPFKWTDGTSNLHPFYETITKDYFDVNPRCVYDIMSAYNEILIKAKEGLSGLEEISQLMGLCTPLKDQLEMNRMIEWTKSGFAYLAMFNYPYPSAVLAPLPAFPVNVSCNRALESESTIGALREAISVYYNSTGVSCYDYKYPFVDCSYITGCGIGKGSIYWNFQGCTELHLYDDSTSAIHDMFPSIQTTLIKTKNGCYKKFGVHLASNDLLTTFGGESAWKRTSNIVFSNGDLDPWINGGVLEDVSDSVIALIIKGAAHHLDLCASHPNDPQSVRDARVAEVSAIWKWLGH